MSTGGFKQAELSPCRHMEKRKAEKEGGSSDLRKLAITGQRHSFGHRATAARARVRRIVSTNCAPKGHSENIPLPRSFKSSRKADTMCAVCQFSM